MSTRRNAKIAQAIRQIVSTVVLFELRDPRIANVTVLGTEVAEDLQIRESVCLRAWAPTPLSGWRCTGLNSARGFIQSRIADELKLRQTPILYFALDQGVKQSIHVSKMLREAMDHVGAARRQ